MNSSISNANVKMYILWYKTPILILTCFWTQKLITKVEILGLKIQLKYARAFVENMVLIFSKMKLWNVAAASSFTMDFNGFFKIKKGTFSSSATVVCLMTRCVRCSQNLFDYSQNLSSKITRFPKSVLLSKDLFGTSQDLLNYFFIYFV